MEKPAREKLQDRNIEPERINSIIPAIKGTTSSIPDTLRNFPSIRMDNVSIYVPERRGTKLF